MSASEIKFCVSVYRLNFVHFCVWERGRNWICACILRSFGCDCALCIHMLWDLVVCACVVYICICFVACSLAFPRGPLQRRRAEVRQNFSHSPSQLLPPHLPLSLLALQTGKLPPGQETSPQHASKTDRWEQIQWAIRTEFQGLTVSVCRPWKHLKSYYFSYINLNIA